MIFIFWCLCLLLILAAAMPLARALLRQNGTGAGTAEFDIAVYRDQLRDVERDLDRGVLAPEAAERTRLEISRRILAADKARAATDAPRPIPPLANGAALVLMAVLIAGGSLWSYAHLGAPGYGDQPLAQRRAAAEVLHATRPSQTEAEALAVRPPQPEADAGYRELVAQLREKLAERPDDPRGLQLLAQNEANLGNFNAAYAAQIRLLEILGDQAPAQGYAELTEFYVMAAGGYVSPEAETALRTALLRDPSNGPARYYLGLMQAQTGRPDLAFRTWRILLEQSAPDAPWMSAIRAQIQQAAAQAGVDYTLPPLPAAPARAGRRQRISPLPKTSPPKIVRQ